MATVGRPKLEVMTEMARAINPELLIKSFPQGATKSNVDEFLESADLYVDGLDFFVLDVRRAIFARCSELGIPAITAAPIGMGSSWISFVPGGMTFEEYFRLEGQPESEQYLRFLMGMAPRGLHRSYLVDPSRVDLAGKKGPSTAASCQLCSGIVGVEQSSSCWGEMACAQLLITTTSTPMSDGSAFLNCRTARMGRSSEPSSPSPGGCTFGVPKSTAPASQGSPDTPIEKILTLARWAQAATIPSPGASRSPAMTASMSTSFPDGNPYDTARGEPTFLSLGMLLETMRIVASGHGRGMEWSMAATCSRRFAIRFPLSRGSSWTRSKRS